MISGDRSPDAIRKSISVACSLDVAFRTWVDSINLWWPKQHSRSGQQTTTVLIEPWAGGRLYERTEDGTEYSWGQISAWDPPHAFAYDWYLGSSPERPTRVEVQFLDEGSGRTRITVNHYGADLIGEAWLRTSPIFQRSWDTVLAAYHAFQQTV